MKSPPAAARSDDDSKLGSPRRVSRLSLRYWRDRSRNTSPRGQLTPQKSPTADTSDLTPPKQQETSAAKPQLGALDVSTPAPTTNNETDSQADIEQVLAPESRESLKQWRAVARQRFSFSPQQVQSWKTRFGGSGGGGASAHGRSLDQTSAAAVASTKPPPVVKNEACSTAMPTAQADIQPSTRKTKFSGDESDLAPTKVKKETPSQSNVVSQGIDARVRDDARQSDDVTSSQERNARKRLQFKDCNDEGADVTSSRSKRWCGESGADAILRHHDANTHNEANDADTIHRVVIEDVIARTVGPGRGDPAAQTVSLAAEPDANGDESFVPVLVVKPISDVTNSNAAAADHVTTERLTSDVTNGRPAAADHVTTKETENIEVTKDDYADSQELEFDDDDSDDVHTCDKNESRGICGDAVTTAHASLAAPMDTDGGASEGTESTDSVDIIPPSPESHPSACVGNSSNVIGGVNYDCYVFESCQDIFADDDDENEWNEQDHARPEAFTDQGADNPETSQDRADSPEASTNQPVNISDANTDKSNDRPKTSEDRHPTSTEASSDKNGDGPKESTNGASTNDAADVFASNVTPEGAQLLGNCGNSFPESYQDLFADDDWDEEMMSQINLDFEVMSPQVSTPDTMSPQVSTPDTISQQQSTTHPLPHAPTEVESSSDNIASHVSSVRASDVDDVDIDTCRDLFDDSASDVSCSSSVSTASESLAGDHEHVLNDDDNASTASESLSVNQENVLNEDDNANTASESLSFGQHLLLTDDEDDSVASESLLADHSLLDSARFPYASGPTEMDRPPEVNPSTEVLSQQNPNGVSADLESCEEMGPDRHHTLTVDESVDSRRSVSEHAEINGSGISPVIIAAAPVITTAAPVTTTDGDWVSGSGVCRHLAAGESVGSSMCSCYDLPDLSSQCSYNSLPDL